MKVHETKNRNESHKSVRGEWKSGPIRLYELTLNKMDLRGGGVTLDINSLEINFIVNNLLLINMFSDKMKINFG